MSLSESKIAPVIAVADMGSAVDFYENKLNLERAWADDEGVFYLCGEGTGFFIYTSPTGATSSATVATWMVRDLSAEMLDLQSRGITFEEYDFPNFQTVDGVLTREDGGKSAWFRDPSGNILALDQRAVYST